MVITIARQFGSGGRKIGKKLADKLGISFYDKKLITLAAKESGMDPEIIKTIDEKATNSLLYSLSIGAAATLDTVFRIEPQLPMNDKLFLTQHDIIKKISADPCVIVGRCSDYILRDRPDCIKLFIYADMEDRIRYATKVYNVPKEKARSVINKTDKTRANYYNYYADSTWGDPNNYDLCINSGKLGTDGSVELIISYLRQRGMVREYGQQLHLS
ncbi:MAG: cytidylate kinase-like family protein [Clostridia bacterium]|nr:cytidylate kinase-like family protein [Clostridia bacterium]